MWVPADRLIAIIDANPFVRFDESAKRRISGLRNGEYEYIGLDTVDRLLIRHGLEWWLHVPKEDGGLADIYENGAQYGNPKSADDSAEAERKRQQSRRAYERKKARRLVDPEYRERERARWRANRQRLRRAA